MKKQYLVVILFFFLLISLGYVLLFYTKDIDNYDSILYSWKLESIKNDEKKFETILEDYKINVIYQDFTTDYLKEFDDSFIEEMGKRNIKVYHLCGDPSWGKEDGYEKIKKEVLKVVNYNNNVSNKVVGVVLDIEPYISEKEEIFLESDFRIYVEQIKKAYKMIKENDLEVILAIPYWFDKIDVSLLEELVMNSDGISVMNYKISDTSEHIETEIKLAKKYNKKIDTIYEVEYGESGYFNSKDEIYEDYYKIKDYNEYKDLGISFHYFDSM